MVQEVHSYQSLAYNHVTHFIANLKLKENTKAHSHNLSHDTPPSFYCPTFKFEGRIKVHYPSLTLSFPYFSFTIFVKEWHINVSHISFSPKRSIFS